MVSSKRGRSLPTDLGLQSQRAAVDTSVGLSLSMEWAINGIRYANDLPVTACDHTDVPRFSTARVTRWCFVLAGTALAAHSGDSPVQQFQGGLLSHRPDGLSPPPSQPLLTNDSSSAAETFTDDRHHARPCFFSRSRLRIPESGFAGACP